MTNRLLSAAAAAVLVTASASPLAATRVILINADNANEGLNDPSPRDPVGGNPGDTVGAQRRNAMLFAAELLASRVVSSVPIVVEVEFSGLPCDPGSAQLGGAGATLLFNFDTDPPPGALAGVFYPSALANALSGRDLSPDVPEIGAEFTSALDGNSGLLGLSGDSCLGGADWYYGFDDHPSGRDLVFVSTAVHELIHGLGFASYTDLQTGEFPGGPQSAPDIYTTLIRDQAVGRTWPDMGADARAASAINDPDVVWAGALTTSSGAPTRSSGSNGGQIRVYAPNPLEPGSSISHWDVTVFPNDLMEPFATADIVVSHGIGLASCLLHDIGWHLASGVRCPDEGSQGLSGGSACMGTVCGIAGSPDTPPADPPPDSGSGNGGSENGSGVTSRASNGGFGGGGGCTLAADAAPDPLWLLALGAVWGLRRRYAVGRKGGRAGA